MVFQEEYSYDEKKGESVRILSGKLKGRCLKTSAVADYRPAMAKVRQAIFSMLEARLGPLTDTSVLDLYAGTGSLAFEALSRGSAMATCVEKNAAIATLIADNARSLGLSSERLRVIRMDVLNFLRNMTPNPYPLVFIDPPYKQDNMNTVLQELAFRSWLIAGSRVCIEVSRQIPADRLLFPDVFSLDADKTYGQTRVLLFSYGG